MLKEEEDDEIQEIVYDFKEYTIRCPEDLTTVLGIKYRMLNSGAYRTVVKLVGLPLVVKFPLTDMKCDKKHSEYEFRAVNKILRYKYKYKYRILRKYVPKIYYFNKETGVLIGHYYRPLKGTKKEKNLIANLVSDVVDSTWDGRKIDKNNKCRYGTEDMWDANMALNKSGHVKIIDMGFFYENKGSE